MSRHFKQYHGHIWPASFLQKWLKQVRFSCRCVRLWWWRTLFTCHFWSPDWSRMRQLEKKYIVWVIKNNSWLVTWCHVISCNMVSWLILDRCSGKLKIDAIAPSPRWTVCPVLSKSSRRKWLLQSKVLTFATNPWLLRARVHACHLSRSLWNLCTEQVYPMLRHFVPFRCLAYDLGN